MVTTKDEINDLSIETFKGDIIIIDAEKLVKDACDYLSSFKVVGFDTESKPAFQKGVENTLSLIQLSSNDRCYLFRVNVMESIPKPLNDFLTSKKTKKVGLSLKDDFARIKKFTTKHPENTLDIQNVIEKYNIGEMSLKKIYATLFKKRITKKQQLSNWDTEELTKAQQMYAAIDAWACLKIYEKLESIDPKYLR